MGILLCSTFLIEVLAKAKVIICTPFFFNFQLVTPPRDEEEEVNTLS